MPFEPEEDVKDGEEDLTSQITMSYDAFAADKDSFYCYSEVRGLTRAIKGPQGQWKKVVACNRELRGLHSVSLVLHKDMLLMRHAGVKDAPFIRID